MTIPGAELELAAIHAAFAENVTYTGAGLSGGTVPSVESDTEAAGFMGSGAAIRTKAFEVRYAALPGTPAKGDVLTEADGTVWRVIERQQRDDISAWVLIVEEDT